MIEPTPETLRRIAAHLEANEKRWANHLPRRPLATADAWLLINMLEGMAIELEYKAAVHQ